jgi:hypothetical protein
LTMSEDRDVEHESRHGTPSYGLPLTDVCQIKQQGRTKMPTKTMAAALVAAAIPLYAGPTAAGPLSQSLALNNADVGTVEQVQYRRWGRGYYGYGPGRRWGRGYYAYGAAPRWGRGYYAYAAAPRWGRGYYAFGAAPGYIGPGYRFWDPNYGNGGAATTPRSDRICASDREDATAWPSWFCR